MADARHLIFSAVVVLLAAVLPARAQLEQALMPGKVIAGHAKLEEECGNCHVAFDKRAQDRLCLGCHKEVAADVAGHAGMHGRIRFDACRPCHTEHKGREVNIAAFDERKFDHAATDFVLAGAHRDVKCNTCHVAGRKFRAAPGECTGCHRKDDRHKGRFGEKCESCHNATEWKAWTFDHDTATRFVLRFKHRTARCDSCHAGNIYKDKVEATCVSCHRKDDKHKGSLGPRCGDCHTEQNWAQAKFDHGKTHFPLTGQHADAACKSCHRDLASFKGAPLACNGCHAKDDKHKARFGEKCESCHADTSWKNVRFAHDRDTPFRLIGAHRKATCEKCHAGTLYRDKTPTLCLGCHQNDDKHLGQLGARCESCHVEDDWKRIVRFDHGQTRFPLLGRHVLVECKSCHATLAFKDAKSDCLSCHVKDDAHRRTLGTKCEACHNARTWKAWDFNHDRRTKFALDGGHVRLACNACHRAPVKDDARLPTACVACHEKEDAHEGRFGRLCERCHTTDNFKRIKPGMGQGARP